MIGNRIKEARINLKLSQEQLGEKLGVSKVTISGYENGTRIPNLKHLVELSNVLNITTEYILRRDVLAVAEEETEYRRVLAREDFNILDAIKREPKLYKQISEDSVRTVELIVRKLYK